MNKVISSLSSIVDEMKRFSLSTVYYFSQVNTDLHYLKEDVSLLDKKLDDHFYSEVVDILKSVKRNVIVFDAQFQKWEADSSLITAQNYIQKHIEIFDKYETKKEKFRNYRRILYPEK